MIYSQQPEGCQNYLENRSSPPSHDRKAARQSTGDCRRAPATQAPLFKGGTLSRMRRQSTGVANLAVGVVNLATDDSGLRSLTLACLLSKAEKHLSFSCFPIPIYCEGTLGSVQFPCQAVYNRRSRGVAQFIAPLSSFVKRFCWPPDRFLISACQVPANTVFRASGH